MGKGLNPTRLLTDIATAGTAEAYWASKDVAEGNFTSAVAGGVGGGVGTSAVLSGVASEALKTPKDIASKGGNVVNNGDQQAIADAASADEKRRRALVASQNRLMRTTPLGAKIGMGTLGGQNVVTGA
jgi:hypothetical protein